MHIDKIQIKEFRVLENITINFIGPENNDNSINVIAGVNGSGKTSLLEAIKLGGLTGQGMGEGILKDSVPEAHTDYVIAVISEEFGSLVTIMIIIIFLYISYRIIKNCFRQENQFLKISLSLNDISK